MPDTLDSSATNSAPIFRFYVVSLVHSLTQYKIFHSNNDTDVSVYCVFDRQTIDLTGPAPDLVKIGLVCLAHSAPPHHKVKNKETLSLLYWKTK
jgi:hypothetical protein